jgi:cytochrome c oxidase cbb3-type subunit I/II
MNEPTSMSPGSVMPAYPWLVEQDLGTSQTTDKLKAMKTLGVPYEDLEISEAQADLEKQARSIVANLAKEGIQVSHTKEIIAMIAYLQRLGTDIKVKAPAN